MIVYLCFDVLIVEFGCLLSDFFIFGVILFQNLIYENKYLRITYNGLMRTRKGQRIVLYPNRS